MLKRVLCLGAMCCFAFGSVSADECEKKENQENYFVHHDNEREHQDEMSLAKWGWDDNDEDEISIPEEHGDDFMKPENMLCGCGCQHEEGEDEEEITNVEEFFFCCGNDEEENEMMFLAMQEREDDEDACSKCKA